MENKNDKSGKPRYNYAVTIIATTFFAASLLILNHFQEGYNPADELFSTNFALYFWPTWLSVIC